LTLVQPLYRESTRGHMGCYPHIQQSCPVRGRCRHLPQAALQGPSGPMPDAQSTEILGHPRADCETTEAVFINAYRFCRLEMVPRPYWKQGPGTA